MWFVSAMPLPAPGCASCASRDVVIEELASANARLAERVAGLERLVGRNSDNSSMPPSTDDLPGRKAPSRKTGKRSERRRGKQPGAAGAGLPRVDNPDETVQVFPETCADCGVGLADGADAGVSSRQVFDVPPVTVRVTEYMLYKKQCRCGCVTAATPPAGVADAPVSYGPNLQAFVAYLLVFQHVPVHRAAMLIADLTGARPSTGFVHGILRRCAHALGEVMTLVKTLVTGAMVAGFDETTLRCGPAGRKKYVLSASTELCTLFFLGGRDLGSFTKFGVLPGFTGVAVHDRYSVYDNRAFAGVGGHQICCAHILRDLQDAAEVYPGQHWPEQASRALRALIVGWHQALDGGQARVPADVTGPLVSQFRHAVRVGLSQVPSVPGANAKQLPGRSLLECLRDRQDDLFRFCSDTRVWPTNNISERDLRPLKTQQKISGRLQSADVTRDRLTIRGYISTAAQHRVDIMTALRDAMTRNPWTPPIPAPT